MMLQQRHGAIINVSSVAAYFVSPGSAAYCATKLFLNSFTESLHLELHGTGVRVQALCPGYTTSDFHRKLGYDTTTEFFRNFMPAERVVETSLRYLDKGRIICIPGFKYKIAAQLPRIIPRPLLYRLTMLVTKGKKYPAPR
jgi:short-subunit dehydrogenase